MTRKYYKYIPIFKSEEMPEIKNVGKNQEASLLRHLDREKDALTEVICQIADSTDSKLIRKLFLKYDIKLVEDSETGSRKISASFPDKRFY